MTEDVSGRVAVLHGNRERAAALARMLRQSGHGTTIVGEGAGAASALVALSPDLVVGALSFEEPPLRQVVAGVREALARHVPLLLVVGREDAELPLTAVDDVVREPVDPRELGIRVAAMLRMLAERRILERKLGEVLGLHGASSASFSLAGGAEALFGHLARQSAELLEAEKGLVVLYDPQRREMVGQAPAWGLVRDKVARVRYPVDGEAREIWNFRTNGPLLSNEAGADRRLLTDLVAELDFRSVLIVPMTRGPQVLGLLGVADRPARPFGDEDLRLLQAVAGQAAVAVENQRLHEELKEANARLQEMDRLKSEFVTMVAHDFRNPLMAIRGFAELVLEDSDIGAETRREFMRTIIGQTEDLARLAEDTFLITQMESGQFSYRWSEVEMGPFVLDAASRVPSEHPVTIDVPPGLPPIVADPERLRQVVANLVSNAVKYSPEQAKVAIRCRESGPGRMLLEVLDSGLGIPPEQVGRLFQKFGRVRSEAHDQVSGTGLGLYICRLIVEGHGGRIWVESQPGKGSTFSVLLPVRRETQPTPPTESPATEAAERRRRA